MLWLPILGAGGHGETLYKTQAEISHVVAMLQQVPIVAGDVQNGSCNTLHVWLCVCVRACVVRA